MNRILFATVVLIGAGIGILMPSGAEPPPARPVATAQLEAEPFEDEEEAEVTRLEREEDGHFYVHGEVNGELVRFLIDTGATPVALTIPAAERLGIPFSQSEFEEVGRGASGPVRGQRVTIDSLSIDGKRVTDLSGVVVEGLEISLLGQAYLSRIGGVEMRGDEMLLE